MIFDTHAHYDCSAYDEDRDSLLTEIHSGGVGAVMNCGTDAGTSRTSLELALRYDWIYAAVGIHPEELWDFTDESLAAVAAMAAEHPDKVRAIGEIGLDYVNGGDRDTQRQLFARQIGLARELGLPVIVHDREAHADTMDILARERASEVGGVLHCYSGSAEMLRQVADMDMYIGVGGVLTFKNAVRVKEVVRAVPRDRLVVETDAPYMTAVPYRGRRNRSDYISFVLDALADIWGEDRRAVEDITWRNGQRLFGVGEASDI